MERAIRPGFIVGEKLSALSARRLEICKDFAEDIGPEGLQGTPEERGVTRRLLLQALLQHSTDLR